MEKRYLVTGNWTDKTTGKPVSGIAEISEGINKSSKPYGVIKTDSRKDPINGAHPNGTILIGANSLSLVIKDLHDIFECFNGQYFESSLSKPIITAASKGRKKAIGWCTTQKIWRDIDTGYYEINICAEHMNAPIEDVCEVLLHEMCHLYNLQNNIQDCSRSSQYHNVKFKNCADQHGLNVEKHSSCGYAITSLKPETLEYIKTLNLTNFKLFRDSPTGEEKKKSSTRKYICPNGCDVSIRATKEVNVICGTCKARLVQD